MRILVTGGAGFIGSHYVRTLLRGGLAGSAPVQVTVLDKLTNAGNLGNLGPVAGDPRYAFVRGDIGDAALLARLVPGHDAVINFAAETHVDRSIMDATAFTAANVAGVQVLLQARSCNNYGPYQYPEKIIPLFVTNLLDGRELPLYGTAGTCAAGSMSMITAGASRWCSNEGNPAGCTTSAAPN
jgi:dTDP-D-glucose 4,6-dehydratase